MPVYYKGERTRWYIRGMDSKESINLNPDTFDPDKLPGNEIVQGNNGHPIVKIPKTPNRITIRKDGYVELILCRSYDKEAKQSRNKKTIIGSCANRILPGMMLANDTYYEYYNIQGTMMNDPWHEEENPEGKKPKTVAEEGRKGIPIVPEQRQNIQQTKMPKQSPEEQKRPNQTEVNATEPIKDEVPQQKEQKLRNLEAQIKQREKELLELDQEIESLREEQAINANETQREHIKLLSYMLENFKDIVTPPGQ